MFYDPEVQVQRRALRERFQDLFLPDHLGYGSV